MSQDHLGLFDTPYDRREVRICLVIVGVLVAAALFIIPVRNTPLPEVVAFIPMIDALMFLGELITATLLFAQAAVFRSRALAILASAYVFGALLLISHALTFPGAFAPQGLLGAGVNSTAWIAVIRRAAFPVAVIAYVLLKQADSATPNGAERPRPRIGVGLFAAIFLAAAVTLLTTAGHDLLPPYYLDRAALIYSNAVTYQALSFVVFLVAAVMLFRTRSTVLDIWMLVALSGWLTETALIMTLEGRFTAGFYWLYFIVLGSHLVVMLALLAESNRLFARLALSASAQHRERDTRLMSMDAVAAAVAHEVGQPLTALMLNVKGGLAWLTRPTPDVAKAITALHAAIDAGAATFEAVKSSRAIFATGPGATSEFALNDLVRTTASLMSREIAGRRMSLQLALDETLPPILADRIQLQRVLVNLFTNAMESLEATPSRPRHMVVRTLPLDGEQMLEISDNGIGIDPGKIDHIFDAFYTTKPTGTGLGLSLCRTIVEEHGGRLWASPGEQHGATFHLLLPSSGLYHPDDIEPEERPIVTPAAPGGDS